MLELGGDMAYTNRWYLPVYQRLKCFTDVLQEFAKSPYKKTDPSKQPGRCLT